MSHLADCQKYLNQRNKTWTYSLLWSKSVSKPISTRTAVCQNIFILQSIQNLLCLFLHKKLYFTCPKKLHPQMLGKGDANESNWGRCLYEDKDLIHISMKKNSLLYSLMLGIV